MKKTTLIGALLLLLGIGIGLILKSGRPSADEPTAGRSSKSDQRPGASASGRDGEPGSGTSGKSDRISGKPWQAEGTATLEFDQGTREAFEEAQAFARARVVGAEDRQLAALTGKLSLTPAQQQELRARYFDPLREKVMRARLGARESERSTMPQLGKVLGEILTAEQASTYRQLQADQRRRENESRTHRELARLSFLDLTPEQRQGAYDAIYSSPARLPIEGITMDMTADEEGAPRIVTFKTVRVNGGLTDQVHAIVATSTDDPAGSTAAAPAEGTGNSANNIEEARAKAIARDVARFEKIFTPEQMASYRDHLEARQAGEFTAPIFSLPPLPE